MLDCSCSTCNSASTQAKKASSSDMAGCLVADATRLGGTPLHGSVRCHTFESAKFLLTNAGLARRRMNDVLGEDHEEDEQYDEREPHREGQTTESGNHSW